MKNFIKGFFVGIANITPGISGSALLVSLNLYEKCINSISNIFKDFKKNFTFLLPITLGVFIGTFLFSNIIFYFYNNLFVHVFYNIFYRKKELSSQDIFLKQSESPHAYL